MNSKGYTLVEVLAVITILGVLLLIAVPSISKLQENVNKRIYEKDKELFEQLVKQKIMSNINITIDGEKVFYLSDIDKNKLNGVYDEEHSKVIVSKCGYDDYDDYTCSYETILTEKKG